MEHLPIDVSPARRATDAEAIADEIDLACHACTPASSTSSAAGFRSICEAAQCSPDAFFALPDVEKAAIGWRRRQVAGIVPPRPRADVRRPDRKEGLYFGKELAPTTLECGAGRPLHGPNLFPSAVPELGPAVLG